MDDPSNARDDAATVAAGSVAVPGAVVGMGADAAWRLDALACVALGGLTSTFVAWEGRVHRVDVAVGPDTPLWGGAALDLVHGTSSIVPPLYPTFLSLAAVFGAPVADAGRYVSMGAAGLASALAYAATRAAGARRVAALLAGGVVAVHPDTTLLGLMFQPDALTMAAFAGFALGAVLHARTRTWRSAAWLALGASLLAMTREHGVVLMPLVAVLLFLVPPLRAVADAGDAPPPPVRLAARLGALGLLAGVLHMTTMAVRLPWETPPWRWPWLFKVAAPLDDVGRLAQRKVPPYVAVGVDSYPSGDPDVLLRVERAYDQLMRHSDVTPWRSLAELHVARAWTVGGDVYALLLAGLVGAALLAVRERRGSATTGGAAIAAGLATAVVTVLPTLVVWSARRHVAVLVPVGAVGLGLGAHALFGAAPDAAVSGVRRWGGRLAVAASLGFVVVQGAPLRAAGLAWLRERAAERHDDAAFGRAIRAATREGTLLAGYSPGDLVHEGGLVHLYAERAWVSLDEGQEHVVPSLAWRATRVTTEPDAPAREGWREIARVGALRAWTYRPDVTGEARRCPEGTLLRAPRFVAVRQLPRYPLAVAEGCPPATRGFVSDPSAPVRTP